jgi:hypothetical protein
MNYDTMSVDEWLQTFYCACNEDGKTEVYDREVTMDEIKSALRKAVIREASVGTVTFTKDGENSVVAFDGITHLEKISDTYFGSYCLIPKQTS